MGVAPALLATLAAGGRVTRLALDLIFPPRCVGCGEFETLLCEVCRADLKPLAEGCRRCGRPDMVSTHHGWCRDCVGRRLGFASAGSAFAYEGVAQELVVALKYGGQKKVAEPMAEAAADVFRRCLARPGLPIVTWVPSHPAVTRERGYNQAEVLARALACRSEVEHVMPLARKVKRTAHQQALSREERAENLAGAFVGFESPVSFGDEAWVMLVDDVFTTGATSSEVASAITARSGLEVHVFTFARALGEVPCFTD